MDSDEKIMFTVITLLMLSLPTYLTIHFYNREVVPNLARVGWTIATVDQVVHIVIFWSIAGIIVEGFILVIIEYILNNI